MKAQLLLKAYTIRYMSWKPIVLTWAPTCPMQRLRNATPGLSLCVLGTGMSAIRQIRENFTLRICRYDFDLKTGHSETGLKACTYATDIRVDDEGIEQIWIETPEGSRSWRLVEFRPVSEGQHLASRPAVSSIETALQNLPTLLRLFLISPTSPYRRPTLENRNPSSHQRIRPRLWSSGRSSY